MSHFIIANIVSASPSINSHGIVDWAVKNIIPIVMLSFWTLLFATIFARSPAGGLARHEADGPRPAEMLSRSLR